MILNRNESEVTVLGEVQKHKVGIDERNINHIVTILSSNLYSHPMQSFLREIVSNAIDSHIEAGVNEPVIITITDNDLSIRDFGTGISPERFEEIFLNIGSSTKRDSNDYIGSFGIGRFASLAVADVVNITSFYNGRAYYYVMNKDIDQLHIDLILDKDTDEHNGVEVKIPFKSPMHEEDWKCLSFIKNIYIEDERKYPSADQCSIVSSFNKRKVYNYKTFKLLDIGYPYSTKSKYTEVLIGSIPYRVDYGSLWEEELYDNWERAFKMVCPCIQIGEVDITPNREGLLYSERTKKVLRKAYNDAIDEMTQLWEASCKEEYTNFKEFANAIYNHYGNKLKLQGVDVSIDDDLPYNIKMKGFPDYGYKELKEILRTLLYSTCDCVIACYANNEMQKGQKVLSSTILKILDKCDDGYTTMLAVPSAYGFSSKYIKGFLDEQFPNQRVMILREPSLSIGGVKYFIRQKFGITSIGDSERIHLIIACLRHLLKYLNQHVRRWDIINSPEYIQYKEDNKEEKVYMRDSTKIPCHIWCPGDNTPETQTDTPNNIIRNLRSEHSKKCRIVYAQLDSPFIFGFKGISYPNLIIIGLAQNNYALAEKGLFPDYVRPIEELYSADNRILQRMAAMMYVRSKVAPQVLNDAFPKPLREMASKLSSLDSKYYYNPRYDYRYDGACNILKVVPQEKYDHEILALYHQLEKAYDIQYKTREYRYGRNNFCWYFLMKAKKFRMDYDYYKMIKNEIKQITEVL